MKIQFTSLLFGALAVASMLGKAKFSEYGFFQG